MQPTPATTPASNEVDSVAPTAILPGPRDPVEVRNLSATLSELSVELKIQLFHYFQAELQHSFPFITLDFDKTGSHDGQRVPNESNEEASHFMEFTQTSYAAPFTVAACLLVALHRRSGPQRHVARELLVSITSALLLNGHKSFDLLQCLIILCAWYVYHVIRVPQLHNLLHLAQSLAIDINLAQYGEHSGLPNRIWPDVGAIMFGEAQGSASAIAEQRLTLGLYYVQAIWAVSLRRLEYPRWSSRLDVARTYLQQHGNGTTDLYAMHITSALKIASNYLVPTGIRPSSALHIRAYTRCFTDEMSRFHATLAESLSSNKIFTQELMTLEIALHDLVIDTPTPSQPLSEKLEALHNMHALITSFWDNFLSLPLETYPLMNSITVGSQLSQAFEVLTKLHCITDVPGWDMDSLPSSTHFNEIADCLAERFEEVFLLERQRFPQLDCYYFAILPIKVRQWKRRFKEVVAKARPDVEIRMAERSDVVVSTPVRESLPQQVQQSFGTPSFDDFLQWPYPLEELGWP